MSGINRMMLLYSDAAPAPPGALYADDFNRADGPVGGSWSGDPAAYAIVSGRLTRTNAGTDWLMWNAPLPSPDQFVEADVWLPGSDSYAVIHARADGFGDDACYMAFIQPSATSPTDVTLAKDVEFGFGNVATFTGVVPAHAPPWKLRLEVQGSTQRVYIDGVLAGTTHDTSITAGPYVGFNGSASGDPAFDNFRAGVLP